MRIRAACPGWGSSLCKKNGHIHTGKQNHHCQDCGRQVVIDTTQRGIDAEQRLVVERLLGEKIALRGIGRALRVSSRWRMDFLVARVAAAPQPLHVRPVAASRSLLISCLVVEADAVWSFVQKQATPHRLWLALDRQTRQILAFHVGDRSRESAKQVWANTPAGYREQATFYPD